MRQKRDATHAEIVADGCLDKYEMLKSTKEVTKKMRLKHMAYSTRGKLTRRENKVKRRKGEHVSVL
jgi:hypothetical protein